MNITPTTIQKNIASIIESKEDKVQKAKEFIELASIENIEGYIKQRESDMKKAAKALNFEEAAMIRDEIRELKRM